MKAEIKTWLTTEDITEDCFQDSGIPDVIAELICKWVAQSHPTESKTVRVDDEQTTIKEKLIDLGFSNKKILNNRGLIGAVINEVLQEHYSEIDELRAKIEGLNDFIKDYQDGTLQEQLQQANATIKDQNDKALKDFEQIISQRNQIQDQSEVIERMKAKKKQINKNRDEIQRLLSSELPLEIIRFNIRILSSRNEILIKALTPTKDK